MFARKHLTCPRKIKVALVKRPVAFVIVEVNFHIIIVRTINNFAICHLPLHATACYRNSAPYKTGVGCESPISKKATPDAASVFFVVRYMRHSMAWCVIRQRSYNRRSVALLAYHAAHNGAVCSYRCAGSYPLAPMSTSRRPRMVTLAGQPQGWPVSFLPGTLTPVDVTAPIECESLGGDSLTSKKEAAAMVATPTQTHPKFIWRFWSCQQSRYITSTATSEHEARRSLVGRYVLSFAGRIPAQEVRHV
ncbi:host cell division inhibitor Icd-like protein [Salmonella enterica subsp. diarizonae]|nr:host cell division inhibitor Icd-like protein [Salmonella enterica subsp. diarizonae]MIH53466.1 host cell division inhibitor Icd-like protein [Salmonella enterica subsp. diarizonae]